MRSRSKGGAGTIRAAGAVEVSGTGSGALRPRLWRYACTRPIKAGSVNASRLATIRSVMREAGNEVKSKAARKEAEVVAVVSGSSFGRLGSEACSLDADEGRFRLSAASAMEAALRFFSSAAALSMRIPCCAKASLI